MTTIDDSNITAPGYWFGEIEHRLRSRMRDELRELGLRRGGWRVLHLLSEGPASAEQLSDRLPAGRRHHDTGRRGGRDEWMRGRRPEWMRGDGPGQHPHDHHEHHEHHDHERFSQHDHHAYPGHPHEHHDHTPEDAFERGFVRGFDRGVRFHRPFGPGPFPPFGRRGHRRPGMVDRVLADFVERGWVWFDGDRATLTDEGRAAHDAAFERVQRVRSTLADGLSEQDVATTMATLQAMARNLGWTPERDAAERDAADATDAADAAGAAGTDGPTR
ncbi:MAG: hypothetical protein ACTHMF_06990 [Leifsonia sp.]|uniref:hypothetical protein n=1 Tax=Leifsonia sp. TaxID=1870902 RepID=UPI003F7F291D